MTPPDKRRPPASGEELTGTGGDTEAAAGT